MQRQTRRLIQAVELIVIGGIRFQIRIALFDDHVAGGAGAASSAGVFDMDAEVDRDV
jgi:hypothetical protein